MVSFFVIRTQIHPHCTPSDPSKLIVCSFHGVEWNHPTACGFQKGKHKHGEALVGSRRADRCQNQGESFLFPDYDIVPSGEWTGIFSLLAFGDFFVCLFYVDCFLCYQTKEQLVLVIVGGRNTISFSLLYSLLTSYKKKLMKLMVFRE